MTSPSRFRRSRWLGIALVALTASVQADEAAHWRDSRQMVLVTVAGWNADHGTLQTFARTKGGGWRAANASVAVTIGAHGAGWGLGLNRTHPSSGPIKREGDNRSPAGVFRIGEAFGYAPSLDTALPYRALSATDWCVDVSGTAQYNRIVDAKVVGHAAVQGATEPMRRDLHAHGDQRYRMGFVIEHNAQQQPGGGSCIFGHLWKSSHDATSGCTAMTPVAMHALLAWLKPEDHPVFVLLTRSAYQTLRRDWQLPRLSVSGAAR